MIEWEVNEDLPMLFTKCLEAVGSEDYAVLIISDFHKNTEEDGDHFEVICNFFPTAESRAMRDQIRLFSLEPEVRFKNADVSVVSYSMEYLMTTLRTGAMPASNIFVVSSLGDTKDIVKRQISKKRAKKAEELEVVRNLILKTFNFKTIYMDPTHPYKQTAYELFKQKRAMQKQRADAAAKFVGDVDLKLKME